MMREKTEKRAHWENNTVKGDYSRWKGLGARTCFEFGLYHFTPLVAPVGDDADDVFLSHLQSGK